MPPLRKALVAMDSFKGSISSEQANQCVAKAIAITCPECHIELFPIGDGGEGTATILTHALHGNIIHTRAHDALMRPCDALYGVVGNDTAIIELANTCGMAQLKAEERNPRLTSSYGCGEVILEALQRGNRHILLCLGGSATNDAGMGLLAALGFQFQDNNYQALTPCGESLCRIEHIQYTGNQKLLQHTQIHILSDVTNPFCGKNGAAHIYAAQKGATPEDIVFLDRGMHHFATVIARDYGKDIRNIQGTGAAGGIAGGCMALLNAQIHSGMDYVLKALQFEEHLRNADLVITGEGKIDHQSFMGKVLERILHCSRQHRVPVVALGGQVLTDTFSYPEGLIGAYGIHPANMPLEQAMNTEQTIIDLTTTTSQVLKQLNCC